MQSRRVTGAAALPIVGGTSLALGLVGLGIAGALTARELASGRNMRADGVVTSEGYGRPRIRFSLPDGHHVEFREPVRYTSWQTGDRTAVAYDPQRPDEARVDGIAGRWFLACLAAVLGGAFTLTGMPLFIAGRAAVRARG